jgi:hypothetical protein
VALADYTDRDRARQEVGAPVDEALALLEEKVEVLNELLYGCAWRKALDSGTDKAKVEAIMEALEHLLGAVAMDLPDRFVHHARVAAQAFALCRVLARGAAVQGRSGVFPGRCGRAPTAPRRRIPWCG